MILMNPRAKAGQVILSISLDKTGDVEGGLRVLMEIGYAPTIRNVALRSGVFIKVFPHGNPVPLWAGRKARQGITPSTNNVDEV